MKRLAETEAHNLPIAIEICRVQARAPANLRTLRRETLTPSGLILKIKTQLWWMTRPNLATNSAFEPRLDQAPSCTTQAVPAGHVIALWLAVGACLTSLMDIRTKACFVLSRRFMRQPTQRTVDYSAYERWRDASLASSWSAFSDDHIKGRDVLDFGCGDGQLALFLATTKQPNRVVGVDLNPSAIERAEDALAKTILPPDVRVDFMVGLRDRIPMPARFFDTVVAFDCMEHVMAPSEILQEWHRVLKPGGRCLIEWFPYKGPWGPHMEALIPIPWAHVIFGERAMFRAAEAIYDDPAFIPRHWDLDEQGRKKPNKWNAWSSFRDQGYINKLDLSTFRKLAQAAGFIIDRLELRSFGGSTVKRAAGRALMRLPLIGEYFVSYAVIELRRT